MIISQDLSLDLAQKEIYIQAGLSLAGRNFVGLRSELYSGSRDFKVSHRSLLSSTLIGSYSAFNSGEYHNCVIGNYCSMADGVVIALNNHEIDCITTSLCAIKGVNTPGRTKFKGRYQGKPIPQTIIGHDVWLGSNVQIKAGTIIGHGSIVGTGAVVTKHIPPYSIVGGCPATIIRKRFPDEDIKHLLKSQWFCYDWQDIEVDWSNRHKCLSQMEEFIKQNNVPKLGDGFVIDVQANKHTNISPFNLTLEKILECKYGFSDMNLLFNLPEVKSNCVH